MVNDEKSKDYAQKLSDISPDLTILTKKAYVKLGSQSDASETDDDFYLGYTRKKIDYININTKVNEFVAINWAFWFKLRWNGA